MWWGPLLWVAFLAPIGIIWWLVDYSENKKNKEK